MESGHLHQDKLTPFKGWLKEQGIETRAGGGEYEVLQVNVPGAGWKAIFRRKHANLGLTVLAPIVPLMKRFLWELKNPPKVIKPVCPSCSADAALVTGRQIYPSMPHLFEFHFWRCAPCDAYVGCHKPGLGYGDGTRPLGTVATEEMRLARREAHDAIDPLWKNGHFAGRGQTYAWLGGKLGVKKDECHIAMFDVAQCQRVVEIVSAFNKELQHAQADNQLPASAAPW